MTVELIPVISSQIAALGWQDNTLYIQFSGPKGSLYKYDHVSEKLFHEFLDAPSAGVFFSTQIKNHPEIYPYQKINKLTDAEAE